MHLFPDFCEITKKYIFIAVRVSYVYKYGYIKLYDYVMDFECVVWTHGIEA